MRQDLLQEMKTYYGNQRWRNVESVEDAELYSEDQRRKRYLDSLVLYGDPNKRRSRYFDRQDREAAKSDFQRRRLSTGMVQESGPRAFMKKFGGILADDLAWLTIR